jgi:hypothetical protein
VSQLFTLPRCSICSRKLLQDFPAGKLSRPYLPRLEFRQRLGEPKNFCRFAVPLAKQRDGTLDAGPFMGQGRSGRPLSVCSAPNSLMGSMGRKRTGLQLHS